MACEVFKIVNNVAPSFIQNLIMLKCLSPCQYYEYSFHCIHAIWICVKYCKALIYSIYFNVLYIFFK